MQITFFVFGVTLFLLRETIGAWSIGRSNEKGGRSGPQEDRCSKQGIETTRANLPEEGDEYFSLISNGRLQLYDRFAETEYIYRLRKESTGRHLRLSTRRTKRKCSSSTSWWRLVFINLSIPKNMDRRRLMKHPYHCYDFLNAFMALNWVGFVAAGERKWEVEDEEAGRAEQKLRVRTMRGRSGDLAGRRNFHGWWLIN